ncbi:hypothetical protein ES703_107210 [subsurface metagenome]
MRKISSALARRLPLHSQLLDGRTKLPKGKEGIAQAIEKLGYVQIDTIAVINRAHHHTLWTRRPDYSPAMLDELQAKDRRVFEYWGHAASYLPMKDYRYYIPRMRAFPWGDGWIKRMHERHKDVMKDVLERITKEGPLGSADFKAPDGKKRGAWWDWKPAKTALELLMWRGDLMVTERRNFQRIYDLTERVLPGGGRYHGSRSRGSGQVSGTKGALRAWYSHPARDLRPSTYKFERESSRCFRRNG